MALTAMLAMTGQATGTLQVRLVVAPTCTAEAPPPRAGAPLVTCSIPAPHAVRREPPAPEAAQGRVTITF